MPVKIPNNLPAANILNAENIFVMTEDRAVHQDIRPLKIVILNLMPNKITTETQILRLLGNTPLQIEITLLYTETYQPKNTARDHLANFYKSFAAVRNEKFDGMIITGAPVGHIQFEAVDYWPELSQIMHWSKQNVFSVLHLCWGALAGLYFHYQIPKYPLTQKMFGVYPHRLNHQLSKLLRGFDDVFWVPHSRHTEVRREDVVKCKDLQVLAESDESGLYLLATADYRQVFILGHAEYDTTTLADEYLRDRSKGLAINIPANYFPADDPSFQPASNWRAHAHLLFANWLNYCVYQETPFSLTEVG